MELEKPRNDKFLKLFLCFLMTLSVLMEANINTVEAIESDTYNTSFSTTINVNSDYYYDKAYEVLDFVNEEREAAGVDPLEMDSELLDAAMIRSTELSLYWSHTRPDGTSCSTINSKVHGENIAANTYDSSVAMELWMNSTDGHRENILSGSFKSIGIGCVYAGGRYYWTQDFSYNEADTVAKESSYSNCTNVVPVDFVADENHYAKLGTHSLFNEEVKYMVWTGMYNSDIDTGYVNFESSNPSSIAIDLDGFVTFFNDGDTTITGYITGCPDSAVTLDLSATFLAGFAKTKLSMETGDTETLEIYISPATNSDYQGGMTFSSSDTSVVTVDKNAKVTAVGAGTAKVYVTLGNGKSGYTEITVTDPIVEVTGVSLNKSSVSLALNKSTTLTATVKPSNADDQSIYWSSSNESVAIVDSYTGKVTANGVGTATITAKATNGKKATCKVTVTNPIKYVTLSKHSLSLDKGSSTTLTATITPSDTTDSKTITWSSSNTSVATVNSSGKVTGKAKGTATITAKTSNGEIDTCAVTVTTRPITSVALSKTSLTLGKGKTKTLTASINPSNTTDSKTLTWSSSNTSVATVNSKGKITAKKVGTATIKVKTSNGKTASCKVTVKKDFTAAKVSISKSKYTYTGKSIKPSVTVKISGKKLKKGTDYTVSYSSNKKTGKATITIKGKGNYTGSVKKYFYIVPKKVTISSLKASKKALTVKYKKATGASGYQIAYRKKGSSKWKTTTTTSTSKKVSKLTSKKTYEVKVRAYKMVSGTKHYGSYSKVKTVKVK